MNVQVLLDENEAASKNREKRGNLPDFLKYLLPADHMPEDTDFFEGSSSYNKSREVSNFGDEFNIRQEFFTLLSQLSRQDRMDGGHNISTMLLSCTFRGRECSAE